MERHTTERAEAVDDDELIGGGGGGGAAAAAEELHARLAQALVADFGRLVTPVVDYDLDQDDDDDVDVEDEGVPSDGAAEGSSKKRKRGGSIDEHGEDEEGAGQNRKRGTGRATGKVGACEGCGAESKYRCPRCDWRSCGIACVRRHKEETGCSGLRDRTAFVPLRSMNDTHLHSDFNFLQDCMRVADVSHLNKPKMNSIISKRFRIFLYQCRRRRVRVHLLPQGMAKRKQNTSYYSIKDDTMLWRVEWRFPFASGDAQELTRYSQFTAEKLCFVMRVEGLPANEVKYVKFNCGDTLRSALEDTELVEFPTILVLSDDELSQAAFNIVDKQDARNLHRRLEKGKEHQPETSGERPAEHALPDAKETTTTASTTAAAPVTKPPPPIPAPASTEEEANDDDEEEGFAFATLVDY